MSTFGGSSVGRTLVGGAQRNNVGGRMRDQDASASPPVLQLAVVVEYVYQPQAILSNAEIKDKWMSVVNNPELIDVMPVGSVIAQIISDSGGLSATGYTILFPFFSSHIQFPVKIGEIIHVVYQDYVGRGNQLGFWMTRVHGNRAVEDANYTHLDRQFDGLNNLQNWSTNQLTKIQSSPEPGFPNGAGTIDTHTVRPIDNQGDPYAHFLSASQAAPFQSTMEPVPRWNKRPGEFVLQGSNNTMVVFGEDRTGPVDPNVNTKDQEETTGGFSGTIDIVALWHYHVHIRSFFILRCLMYPKTTTRTMVVSYKNQVPKWAYLPMIYVASHDISPTSYFKLSWIGSINFHYLILASLKNKIILDGIV